MQMYNPIVSNTSTYTTRKATKQGKATTLARRQIRAQKYAATA